MIGTIILLAALQSPQVGNPQPVPEKPICKVVVDTQWRTSRERVCMTRAKWARIARETQKAKADFGTSGRFGTAR